jgi:tetratricopeptide (TPR) repeat protein
VIGMSGTAGLLAMQDSPTYAAEYELFKKAEGETNAAQREALITEFIKTYPESVLDPNVSYLYAQAYKPLREAGQWQPLAQKAEAFLRYRSGDAAAIQAATEAYQKLGNPQKLVDFGSKLYQASPNGNTAYFVAKAYQSMGDEANFRKWGENTLKHDANNLQILVEMSNSYWKANDLTRAGDYGTKGLAAASKATKPQGQTDAQWTAQLNQVRGFCHRAVGEKSYIAKDMAAAQQHFEESLKFDVKNDFAHYRLGLIYWGAGKTDAAILALAKASVLNGSSSKDARTQLNQLYKSTYGNTTNLPGLIQKAREELKI